LHVDRYLVRVLASLGFRGRDAQGGGEPCLSGGCRLLLPGVQEYGKAAMGVVSIAL
jgi:hypothetical protein